MKNVSHPVEKRGLVPEVIREKVSPDFSLRQGLGELDAVFQRHDVRGVVAP